MLDIKSGLLKLAKEIATPSTPGVGGLIYFKSDHLLRSLGTDGVERLIDPAVEQAVFGQAGPLAVKTYTSRWYVEQAGTLLTVRASVGTAPTGATIIVDVFKNGTTVFTGGSGRPTIATSGFTATGTPAVTSVAAGDYFTISITQVGSTVAGADATVTLRVSH